jgi:4-hydroxy-2-oxoheptanedioate aldolase
MVAPVLADKLRAGETIFSGWCALPEPLVAELVARAGFGCVTLEMQHGLQDIGSVMRSIPAVLLADKPAVVRIPVGDNATASRVLDMGAEAVIAPMINSVADARAFVAAMKYPPLGERSWGPSRVLSLRDAQPQGHLETSNRISLAFGMIETRTALTALDDILDVDGLDGVFVGPSDLSVTLSDGKKIGPLDRDLDEPIKHIVDRASAHGKIAGIYAVNPDRANLFRSFGFRFIALGSDQIFVTNGAKAMLAGLK